MAWIRSFVGVVRKLPGSDYRVNFPDLPCCRTAGKTMQEARRSAADALGLHLDGMAADGATIPTPRSLGAISDDGRYTDDATTLILVAVPQPGLRS